LADPSREHLFSEEVPVFHQTPPAPSEAFPARIYFGSSDHSLTWNKTGGIDCSALLADRVASVGMFKHQSPALLAFYSSLARELDLCIIPKSLNNNITPKQKKKRTKRVVDLLRKYVCFFLSMLTLVMIKSRRIYVSWSHRVQ
jgi:hypothetical protein